MSTELKVALAQKSAQNWLALIDNFEYENSWSEASSYFQNNVTPDNWVKTLDGVRKPLGQSVFRKLESQEYTNVLPGVPDGEYVIIQYNTVFENKKSALETVVSMLNQYDKWKVSGYFIK